MLEGYSRGSFVSISLDGDLSTKWKRLIVVTEMNRAQKIKGSQKLRNHMKNANMKKVFHLPLMHEENIRHFFGHGMGGDGKVVYWEFFNRYEHAFDFF